MLEYLAVSVRQLVVEIQEAKMANKNDWDIVSFIDKINADVKAVSTKAYVPSIIEFCESKYYLNLPGNDIYLFPMQRVIFKIFYRGQPGNENISLDKEEIELLYRYKMDNVLKKYYSKELFRELVLVLGRRSGKDFVCSIMALYETMKLLEIPGGSPFKYYNMAAGNPIYIVTIATSSDQAKILFFEIQARIHGSVYFRDKIGHTEQDRWWFLTPEDKALAKKLDKEGLDNAAMRVKGSIVIMSGHSNSESLLGKRYAALLFDEVASYKNTGGKSSGERLYSALGPGTSDFTRVVGWKEDGTKIMQTDSKIISISSPRSEEGILFKLYNDAPETKNRLAFKLPTWKVNLKFPEETLRQEHKYMSPNEFNMEFGAEFSGTAGEKFIPDHYVDEAIEMGSNLGLEQRNVGVPGMMYYVHLDPASTSHNYALVLLHIEERIRTKEVNGKTKTENFKLFVVDHLKVWQPKGGQAILVHEVDEYVIDLYKKFRIGLVSYDSWNSLASMQKLRMKGIPTKITPFRKQYKVQIYQHLEHLLVNNQIALPRKGPYAQLMEMELKCLKRIYTPTGFKIGPNEEGQVTTDDFCDSLAGVCGVAVENIYAGYPRSATALMPQSGNDNQKWNIGHGTYTDAQWKHHSRKFGW